MIAPAPIPTPIPTLAPVARPGFGDGVDKEDEGAVAEPGTGAPVAELPIDVAAMLEP